MAMFYHTTAPRRSPTHTLLTTSRLADGYTDDLPGSKYDNGSSRPLSPQSGKTSLNSKDCFSSLDPLEPRHMLNPHRGSTISHTRAPVHGPPPKSFFGKVKYYYDKFHGRNFSAPIILILYALLGAWMFKVIEHDNEKILKMEEQLNLNRLRNDTIHKLIRNIGYRKEELSPRDILLWYEQELHRVKLPEALEWDMLGALFYVGTIITTIGYGNIVPHTNYGRAASVVYALFGIPLVLTILSKGNTLLTNCVTRWWQKYKKHIKEAGKKTKRKLTQKGERVADLEANVPDRPPVEGEEEEKDEFVHSSTIPVWLAFLMCVCWICACAALFLIWEKRWTFSTSLYFFFISLSTIGLGDVVPDYPHMLLLMFFLVLGGLVLVTMLISVIQIRFEEWIYNLKIRLKREAEQALEEGRPVEKGALWQNVLNKEGLMAKIASNFIPEKQIEDVEHRAEQFERIVNEATNKNIQTDLAHGKGMATQVELSAQSMACDPMTLSAVPLNQQTQWSKQESMSYHEVIPLREIEADDHDSISDATSLPLDSVSVNGRKLIDKIHRMGHCEACTHDHDFAKRQKVDQSEQIVQTDIAQFQLDEIVLRLASLQNQRVRPVLVERSMATSWPNSPPRQISDEEEQFRDCREFTDKEILTEVLGVMSRSMETEKALQKQTVACGVNTNNHYQHDQGTNPAPQSVQSRGVDADVRFVQSRTVETEADRLLEISMETSRSSEVDRSMMTSLATPTRRDQMTSPIPLCPAHSVATATTTRGPLQTMTLGTSHSDNETSLKENEKGEERSMQTSPQLAHRMTSPIVRVLVDKTMRTNSADSIENADRSMQTSIVRGVDRMTSPEEKRHMMDQCEQTSLHLQVGGSGIPGSSREQGDGTEDMYTSTDSAGVADTFDCRMCRSAIGTFSNMPEKHLGVSNHRARSSSTSGMGNSLYDEDLRQEVIIQTDDSYLKIARRLDEYRNNRTQYLPVCAAPPIGNRDSEPQPDRPSERRGFFMDPVNGLKKRGTFKGKRRLGRMNSINAAAQTSDLQEQEELTGMGKNEKSRSISPAPRNKTTMLERKASLPTGIARGKVGDFIRKHERGIPNPATERRKPVQIIRQYAVSLEDKGT